MRAVSILLFTFSLSVLGACSRSEVSQELSQSGDSVGHLAFKRHDRVHPRHPAATEMAAARSNDASAAEQAPSTRAPVLAQNSGPLCCCRSFAQGWQHAWRGQSACEGAGGQCVAPDNCRQ